MAEVTETTNYNLSKFQITGHPIKDRKHAENLDKIDTALADLASGETGSAHELGGANHVIDTLSNVNSKISDATLIDTDDSRLSNARTPTAHTVVSHSDTTVTGAELNADHTKLGTVEESADVNNISDVNATGLTDGGETALHTHAISYTPVTHTPAAAATVTLNLSANTLHFITMPAGNITIAISNEHAGQTFSVRVLQDSAGSRTITWFTTIKWADGTVPTLTTTADKADLLTFMVTGTDAYDGFLSGSNI